MSIKRRLFLKGAVGLASVALGMGLLTPRQLLAAWPKQAFASDSVSGAVQSLLGGGEMSESGDIALKAPDIAENGAVVPVSVKTTIPDVESISIIVENNLTPLAASFELGPGAEADVSTRIKMGKTSNVIALIKAGGKLYTTHKEVKVTIGGCGG